METKNMNLKHADVRPVALNKMFLFLLWFTSEDSQPNCILKLALTLSAPYASNTNTTDTFTTDMQHDTEVVK